MDVTILPSNSQWREVQIIHTHTLCVSVESLQGWFCFVPFYLLLLQRTKTHANASVCLSLSLSLPKEAKKKKKTIPKQFPLGHVFKALLYPQIEHDWIPHLVMNNYQVTSWNKSLLCLPLYSYIVLSVVVHLGTWFFIQLVSQQSCDLSTWYLYTVLIFIVYRGSFN